MKGFLNLLVLLFCLNLLGLFGSLLLEDFSPPRALRRWRGALEALSRLGGRAVLTLFYFTAMALYSLPVRMTDPFRKKSSGWIRRHTRDRTLEDARRQY